ncbi:MAG: DUF177 domain-containing protein [Chitinophagales bacterium]|nr:DUF177 domain-containing protein [Chitinophagales bacterium]MDW8393609.1 DUF177 domain-containing protein [Chitinophagales bacterium]
MHPLRAFDIAFVGLPAGVTEFVYTVDEEFFRHYPGSLIEQADVQVNLFFDKQPSFFLLTFRMTGTIRTNCHRCDAELDFPVSLNRAVVVKFDSHREDEADDSHADVVYLRRSDSHLSVAQMIYDFLSLSLSERSITCDQLPVPRTCDPAVTARLQLAAPVADDHRWDELRKIKIR